MFRKSGKAKTMRELMPLRKEFYSFSPTISFLDNGYIYMVTPKYLYDGRDHWNFYSSQDKYQMLIVSKHGNICSLGTHNYSEGIPMYMRLKTIKGFTDYLLKQKYHTTRKSLMDFIELENALVEKEKGNSTENSSYYYYFCD